MNSVSQITLVEQPVLIDWQCENLIQIKEDNLYIYVPENNQLSLQRIQKAARSIEKMGVQLAKLNGNLWNDANQWAFALGFTCANKLTAIPKNSSFVSCP